MEKKAICLIALALLATAALAAPDSLACRMVDWMDAPGEIFYDEGNDCWPPDYSYSGTKNWDLAMGDSFMVWLPGSGDGYLINTYVVDSILQVYSGYVGPWNAHGVCIKDDTLAFIANGSTIRVYRIYEDSLAFITYVLEDWADYHFAALEDSFLYTVGGPGGALTCINVADPESVSYTHLRAHET